MITIFEDCDGQNEQKSRAHDHPPCTVSRSSACLLLRSIEHRTVPIKHFHPQLYARLEAARIFTRHMKYSHTRVQGVESPSSPSSEFESRREGNLVACKSCPEPGPLRTPTVLTNLNRLRNLLPYFQYHLLIKQVQSLIRTTRTETRIAADDRSLPSPVDTVTGSPGTICRLRRNYVASFD